MKTVAVVPCYKSSRIAPKVIKDLIEYVDFVVCVDDFCPEGTGLAIQKQVKSKKVKVIFHQKNKGVGGATKTGNKVFRINRCRNNCKNRFGWPNGSKLYTISYRTNN